MAMQKGKAPSILGGLKTKAAEKPVEYGREFIDLPGGITDGVAQLVEAKIGAYKEGKNQGKPFLYLAGVVVEPKTATRVTKVWKNGKVEIVETKELDIEGQRTSQTLALCETKTKDGKVTTKADNEDRAQNHLRMLAGPECLDGLETDDDFLQFLNDLKESGPFFRFSTSSADPTAQYPTPRVWENWYGTKGLEDYVPEATNGVLDSTGGDGAPPTDVTTATPDPEPEQQPDEPVANEVGVDLAELAARVSAGDDEALKELHDAAIGVGLTEEEWEACNDPDEVLAAMGAKQAETLGAEPEPAPEPAKPAMPGKGEVWQMKVYDKGKPVMVPKSKPPRQKTVAVEVTAVNLMKKTADVKNNADKKTVHKGVKFDDLVSA